MGRPVDVHILLLTSPHVSPAASASTRAPFVQVPLGGWCAARCDGRTGLHLQSLDELLHDPFLRPETCGRGGGRRCAFRERHTADTAILDADTEVMLGMLDGLMVEGSHI